MRESSLPVSTRCSSVSSVQTHTTLSCVYLSQVGSNLVYGLEVQDEQVSVVVAHLPLNDRRDPLQAHTCVHMLLGKNLQLSTGLPVSSVSVCECECVCGRYVSACLYHTNK